MGIDRLAEDRLRVVAPRPPRCPCRPAAEAMITGLPWARSRTIAEVELAGRCRRVSSMSTLADELALGAGLVGDELHAEDLARRCSRASSGDLGELDAAALAAAAGVDLRLDHAAAAQLLADPGRLLRVVGHPAPRGRDPIPAQDLLGLILVDLQDVLLRESSLGTWIRDWDCPPEGAGGTGQAGPGGVYQRAWRETVPEASTSRRSSSTLISRPSPRRA